MIHSFLISIIMMGSIIAYGGEPLALSFPAGFLKGVALSVYQNGGSRNGLTQWDIFATQKTVWGSPAIRYEHRAHQGAFFWDYAVQDISLMQELGGNALRFSVEWAEIEPQEGVFNEEAFAFFERYCHALQAQGIMPTVTLLHFTYPEWFSKKGGFEREENIRYFVRFCTKVFERLHDTVPLWYTINEPTVMSFMGYILGMHAPGYAGKCTMAATVLKNLLIAHTQVYKALKSMPGGDRVQIGLVHQVLQAQAYSTWNPLARFIAYVLNTCSAHQVVKEFLRTGVFTYRIPGLVNMTYVDTSAPDSYDFIGINYYSRVVIGLGPTCYPNEIMTDMEYPIYAPGIYEAIKDMAELKKPLYITENGIPDNQDNRRSQFIKEYIMQVYRAVSDGYDVRGYFYWTLMDNFEWDRGFTIQFGLYGVDSVTKKRTLKPGAHAFRDFFTVASPA